EGIDDRVLLDEELRHIDAERGARYLEFGVKIRTLRRRHFHGAGGEDHTYRRFARDGEQLFQRGIDAGDGAQCGQGTTIGWMDVLVFVQSREFLVWFV